MATEINHDRRRFLGAALMTIAAAKLRTIRSADAQLGKPRAADLPTQCQPPPIVMDDDADVIRIVEGRCAAVERRIIEAPLRRRDGGTNTIWPPNVAGRAPTNTGG